MIRSLKINYLSTAERDLIEIFKYIMQDNPTAAASLLEEIDRSISHLSDNPELCVVPNDDRLKRLGYRILIIRKYLVFYVLKEESVQIRRVLHGARKYACLL